MNIKLALGAGVAIVAVYCVLVIAFVRTTVLYDHYHRYAGIGISLVGAVYLAVNYSKRRRIAPQSDEEDAATDPAATEQAAESDNVTQQDDSFNARYVSLMSVILGVATVFILPLPPTPKVTPVHAAEPQPRPLAKPVPTNAPPIVEPVKPAKPVTFPNVRVQGIILDPQRPSALINGRTYFINDRVQDAKVVEIRRDYVILELQGEQMSYLLEK